ncbi:MAG: hypothetical protein CVV21_03175 [Candidatus Goldiibacteriota bacterium HGW-Goldbacteria-1]|jgi:hypothetical protein|nr:MAG: hypothetical protein CVV21_03175 [Candidatus Goldiibacteriota bacterium HGW-Goldbacteria-1]
MVIRILMYIEIGIFILIFLAVINFAFQFIFCDSYFRNNSNGMRSFFSWNVTKRILDAETNASANDPYAFKLISNLKKSIIFILLAIFAFIINMVVIFWYAYKTGQM